jgi:hypothetical protein
LLFNEKTEAAREEVCECRDWLLMLLVLINVHNCY